MEEAVLSPRFRRFLGGIGTFRLPGPDLCMARFYELTRARSADPLIADLGSGGRRHPLRSIGLDLRPVAGVDVVADTQRLPFRSESFDGVIVTDVLMYVENPFTVAAEVRRVLKPGGVLYAAEPFLYAQMNSASRFRFTVEGLRAVFADLDVIDSGFGRHAGSATLPLIGYYAAAALSFGRHGIHRAMVYVSMLLLKPFLWLDLLISRYGDIPARVYTNSYLLARHRAPQPRLAGGSPEGLTGDLAHALAIGAPAPAPASSPRSVGDPAERILAET